jgi:alpha-beta hydrolase superfamily lysophospholipase
VEVLAADGVTQAVVLVLHGGKAVSTAPSEASHLSNLRMVPFAASIHERGRAEGVAVWRLRYRVRGWNGSSPGAGSPADPVSDARWALDEVRHRHGDVPVVLLGHSMGGRAALRVADDPAVRTAVTLAPWLPAGEPVAAAAGRRVVIVHATRDRWTSPRESTQWAERARAVAEEVTYVRVRNAGHFMVRRSALWTHLATAFVLDGLRLDGVLTSEPSVPGRAANVVRQAHLGDTALVV